MTKVTKIKIFLASSSELTPDRREFELFINRKNKKLIEKEIFLDLQLWEDHLDSISQTRLQDEYNKTIKECHIFVMLFFTKVGKYTEEEFEVAYQHFKEKGQTKIYTYFKDAPIQTGDINENVISLLNFKKKLSSIGHFFTVYKNVNRFLLHFSEQLDELIMDGFIQSGISKSESKPSNPAIASPKKTEYLPQPQKPRFGIHHAYTCDRKKQYGSFNSFLLGREAAQKCHFFYMHGDRGQSHIGLFERFVAKLEGIDKDHLNPKVNSTQNTFSIKITFPIIQEPKSYQMDLANELMTAFQIDENEKKKIQDQNLATILEKSPLLTGAKKTDQVFVLVNIPQTRWNKDLTPQIATWFIEEFCCYKIETGETQNPDLSEDQRKIILEKKMKAQKRLSNGPEFFFFFGIKFKKNNEDIRDEISNALSQAKYTKALDELVQVKFDDIEDWFEYYMKFWDDDDDAMDETKEEYFGTDSEPLDMKDVQKNLKQIINHINDSEKDAIRNS